MAFFFALALLLDSACAAACIPAELAPSASAPEAAANCSEGHHGDQRESCDLHGHLKPVVKDRTASAAQDAPASLASPLAEIVLTATGAAPAGSSLDPSPPLLLRSTVLRI